MPGERIRVEKAKHSPRFREEWVLETQNFTELVEALKSLLKNQGYTVGSKTPRHRGLAAKIYGIKRLEEDHRVRPVMLLIAIVALVEGITTLLPALGVIGAREAFRLLALNPLAVNSLLADYLGVQGETRTWLLLLVPVALLALWAPLHGRGGAAKHLEDLFAGMAFLGLMSWARYYTLVVQDSLLGFYLAGLVELLASFALFSLSREKIYYSSLAEIDLVEVGEIDWWKKKRRIKARLRATLALMELAGGTIRVKPVEAPLSEEDLRVLPEKNVKPVLYRIGERKEKMSREELVVDLFSLVKSEFNKLKTLVEATIEDYRAENQPSGQQEERRPGAPAGTGQGD